MMDASSGILDDAGRLRDQECTARVRVKGSVMRQRALLLSPVLLLLSHGLDAAAGLDAERWRNPPMAARPSARWWWPGGSVDDARLRSELKRLRDAGFGAVEVQPLLLGMSQADLDRDPKVRTVGEAEFFARVATAAKEATALGIQLDVTLGSGWPGGLPMGKERAARQLLMSSIDLAGPRLFRGALPEPAPPSYIPGTQLFLDVLGPLDDDAKLVAVVAARRRDDGSAAQGIDQLEDLTPLVSGDRLEWQVPSGHWRVFAFYENATSHKVLGGAYAGSADDALVVDHLRRRGAEALIEGYADPLLDAAPEGSVGGVFIDSFEMVAELPWTSDFGERFKQLKGYDLTPYLPLLFRKGGETKYGEMVDFFNRSGGPLYRVQAAAETGMRVREDYEEVREALFASEFLGTFAEWADRRGVALRLQAHGGFADYLDAYGLAEVPESEGLFAGGSYDFLKLASSAGHVAGRPVISSESFVEVKLWGTHLRIPEYHLLAGRALSAGINRISYHGVPYPYERTNGKPWYPFPGGFGSILAGPLPITSWPKGELWEELPALNAYLGRLGYAMSRGEHVADIAWLHPERDFEDRVGVQIGRARPSKGETPITRELKAHGLIYDRVSRKGLRAAVVTENGFRVGAAEYRALLIDDLEAASSELVDRAVAIAQAAVPVIVIGELPGRSRGLADGEERDHRTREAVIRLRKLAVSIESQEQLRSALREAAVDPILAPVSDSSMRFAIDHRRSGEEHVILLFNESYEERHQELRIQLDGDALILWNARDGTRSVLNGEATPGSRVKLTLRPAEAAVLTLAPKETGSRLVSR
jgi:hypothetical protein